MPEFSETPFVMGFIEAMFFTECGSIASADFFTAESQSAIAEGQDSALPCDVGYTDLHPDSLNTIRNFCAKKQIEMNDLFQRAYECEEYDESQAGHDLFMTYQGHGVGFWDRSELKRDGLGDALATACGRGEITPFFGGHVVYGDEPFVHVEIS